MSYFSACSFTRYVCDAFSKCRPIEGLGFTVASYSPQWETTARSRGCVRSWKSDPFPRCASRPVRVGRQHKRCPLLCCVTFLVVFSARCWTSWRRHASLRRRIEEIRFMRSFLKKGFSSDCLANSDPQEVAFRVLLAEHDFGSIEYWPSVSITRETFPGDHNRSLRRVDLLSPMRASGCAVNEALFLPPTIRKKIGVKRKGCPPQTAKTPDNNVFLRSRAPLIPALSRNISYHKTARYIGNKHHPTPDYCRPARPREGKAKSRRKTKQTVTQEGKSTCALEGTHGKGQATTCLTVEDEFRRDF